MVWEQCGKEKQLSGQNYFVAPYAKSEYEIDSSCIINQNDLPHQKLRVGLITTDVLSKFVAVVAIKSKEAPDVLAIMEVVQKMEGKPQRFCSDEEIRLNSGVVEEYLEKEGT